MSDWSFQGFAHGADYNPDQWLHMPEIINEDIRLMKLASVNVVTLGIFSWVALEPEEGVYQFEWLDHMIDTLYNNGISVILATPSGARPAWLSARYPEVLRVTENRLRNLHGMRMNHCYTSPVYRELTKKIDAQLAKRYANHPALKGWHISNEFHGECHCELCQEAFRTFLKEKYKTLDNLNHAWWTGFWSKTYTDWSQIYSPSSRGEKAIQGLEIDWKRFVTYQTADFMRNEIETVKSYNPNIPVTTNMIGSFIEVDYPKLAKMLDIASLDVYPEWGSKPKEIIAAEAAFEMDVTRSLKKRSFLLMETTPSMTNWTEVGKMKRPGMHMAGCMQAVAHGADSVMYFQWRKSRGAFEKFHGAVVGHAGHEHTRVFTETAQLGAALQKIGEIAGSNTKADIAIIFDWNNRWAIDASKGPRAVKPHDEFTKEHYLALRRLGVNVDIIDEEQSLDDYKLVIAPMMYMVKDGVKQRIETYVKNGGYFLTTYLSGIVDDNDLCYLGGFPGPLKETLGIWVEELDTLYSDENNSICFLDENDITMQGTYSCDYFCDVIHTEGATAIAVYGEDYYAGTPVITKNNYGKGEGWYLGTHTNADFLTELYQKLIKRAGITQPLQEVPRLVSVTTRQSATHKYLFVINFNEHDIAIELPKGYEMLSESIVEGMNIIKKNGVMIIRNSL